MIAEYDVTVLAQTIITLCAAAITCFVIPWVKAKADREQMDELLEWVEVAVAAAEQIYEAADGDAKKDYVLGFLSSKGFAIDTAELDGTIEAAVLSLHNSLYGTERVAG